MMQDGGEVDRKERAVKLGIVVGSLGRGGTEIHLSQILPELLARKYDVSVFVMGPSGPMAEELAKFKIPIHSNRPIAKLRWLPTWIKRGIQLFLFSVRYLIFAYRHRAGILHFFLPEATILS